MVAPQKITGEVGAEIDRLVRSASAYYDGDDIVFRRILRDCERLGAADASASHAMLASAYQLIGEDASVRHHADNAIKLGANQATIKAIEGHALMNLGFFSYALSCYRECGAPELGFFSNHTEFGFAAGAYHQMLEFLKEGERMNLMMPDDKPLGAIRRAVEILDEDGVTDDALASMLDIAGELLRKNKLFFLFTGPLFSVIDHDDIKAVSLEFVIDRDPEDVTSLNFDLADEIAARVDRIPSSVVIQFSGARRGDWVQ